MITALRERDGEVIDHRDHARKVDRSAHAPAEWRGDITPHELICLGALCYPCDQGIRERSVLGNELINQSSRLVLLGNRAGGRTLRYRSRRL